MSEKEQEEKLTRDGVRKAFVGSNMSVEDYMNTIGKECRLCGNAINYVEKAKMKRYLLEVI